MIGIAEPQSRKWTAYPEYSCTVREWLREDPSHWAVGRLGYLSRVLTGGTPDRSRREFWDSGTIRWMSSGEVNKGFVFDTDARITEEGLLRSNATILPVNSVMIALNGQGKTKGMSAVLKVPSTCNQSLAAIVCDPFRLDYAYLHYYLQSRYKDIRGLVGDTQREGLNLSVVRSLQVHVPPLDEQRAIAGFLDRETGRIDALVKKKERLIELLEEKRAALISQAVTKGLNPDAPMKDSGVEWFDRLPAKWELKRLKHVVPDITVGIVITPAKYYVPEGVPCLGSLNISSGRIVGENLVFISPESNELHRKSIIFKDDLVIVRTGQTGTSAIVTKEFDGCNCIDLVIVRHSAKVLAAYLHYFVNSAVAVRQVAAHSVGAIQAHYNTSTVGELVLPVPPVEDQIAIVRSLDTKSSKLDGLAGQVRAGVDRLREYRTALISAAVTGKIDVREEAA